MTIETKYKLDDVVWIMHNNKACELRINHIIISKDINYLTIKYGGLRFSPIGGTLSDIAEQFLYPSKEELLKSL